MKQHSKNYYDILEVSPLADIKTIRSAYRTLMFKHRCHPDLGGDANFAAEINEAYGVLSDDKKRNEYNLKLSPSVFKTVDTDEKERRKIPRVYINLTVLMSHGGKDFEPSKMADISSLGCRLQTKEALEIGETVEIELAGHILTGRVRWKRMFHPSIFQRIHESGIEFVKEFDTIEQLTSADL